MTKSICEGGFNMAELTIIIDGLGHKELKQYLMSLNGISDVIIKNQEQLEIYIKYNPNMITPKIIKTEILLFLDILKIPSIIAFDKHSTIKTSEYEIIRSSVCCEYCFKGAIDDLFEIDGIEKVESNFNQKNYDEGNNIIINIKYNSDLISIDDMRQIELKLNI